MGWEGEEEGESKQERLVGVRNVVSCVTCVCGGRGGC